jgi:hypothetical protein
LPLAEMEEALLVAAGMGFSGMTLWDQSRPLPYRSGDGQTFPTTSRGRRTALFFTNDHGVHVIDPNRGSASKLRSVDTPDDRNGILSLYQSSRKELRQGRLDIPRRIPPLCGHNLWASNMLGSTLFIPVCDVTLSLIGLIAQFVNPNLERFVAKDGRGMNIVDDRHGFRPAGTEKWLRSGFLDEKTSCHSPSWNARLATSCSASRPQCARTCSSRPRQWGSADTCIVAFCLGRFLKPWGS